MEQNIYARGGELNKTPDPKTPSLFSFLRFLIGNLSSKNSPNQTDSILHKGDKIDEKISNALGQANLTILGSSQTSSTKSIKTNTIHNDLSPSNSPKNFNENNQNREILEAVKITEDTSFPYGKEVVAWKAINSKSDHKHALIGQRNASLVLVTRKNNLYEIIQEVRTHTNVLCFDTFTIWNPELKTTEGVIIVGTKSRLTFMLVSGNFTKIDIVWEWSVHANPKFVKYFRMDNVDSLLLILDANTKTNLTTANIYQFNLKTKHNWLFQLIPLESPTNRADVLNTGIDVILCFVQANYVIVYQKEHFSALKAQRFHKTMEIPSNSVTSVNAFQMGGFAYIAVGGLKPKIFRYHQGHFLPQTILSKSWGLVEEFLPIPARTYRDDLLLLVQHRINFDTHSASIVEALIWNGIAFDVSLDIPCHIGNRVFSGISCILDPIREEGIYGSTILQNGNKISLVIPRQQAPSGLFELEFSLRPISKPLQAEHNLNDDSDIDELQKLVDSQNQIIKEIQETLENSIQMESNDVDIVPGSWHIPELRSPQVDVKEFRIHTDVDEIYFGDYKLLEDDFEISVSSLMEILQNILLELKVLEHLEDNAQKLAMEAESALDNLRYRTHSDNRFKRDLDSVRFNDVDIVNLNVQNINGISVDDFVFLNDDNELILNGSLFINNELTVIKDSTVGSTSDPSKILEAKNIHISKDVHVSIINGIPWDELITEMVMINLDNSLEELHVTGVRIPIVHFKF